METKASHRLEQKIIELERQLEEAHDAIEAIRTGQIDALVVTDHNVHTLYTLKSADQAYRVFIERMAEGAVSLNADGVIVRKWAGREMATTPAVLAQEKSMLAFARNGRRKAEPLNPSWRIKRDWLNAGQQGTSSS